MPCKKGIRDTEVFPALQLVPMVPDTSRQQEILQTRLRPIIQGKYYDITRKFEYTLTALGILAA